MEKRKLYYAVVNDNGEQVLNALKQKGGVMGLDFADTPHNGDIYYINEDGEIDAYDANATDEFQRRVLDEFLGASGVEYVRLSDAEVRDIWRKIYIIADGKEETGKRIIAELEKRGGVNVGNLACTAYHIAYFIEGNGNKITSCDFSKMLDEWGFTRYELPAPTEAEEIKATIERAADEPEQETAAKQLKPFVVSDGDKEHNAAIVYKLHQLGGIDYFNNAGNGLNGGVYYLDNKNRICYYSSFGRFVERMNKNGEYCRVMLEACIDEYDAYKKLLSAPAPAPNDNPKVCVVSDGNKRHNAAIIERLHEYGGIDYLCNANAGEDGFVYYIDNKKRIRYGSMEHFNGESNYNRDYSEIPLQSCVDAYEKKHPQTSKKPRAFIFGEELKIDFTDAIPKGYEVVDEQGDAIESVSFKMRPKRFHPKEGQVYYIALWDDGKFIPLRKTWDGNNVDESWHKWGNCFETEEQAKRLADALTLQYNTSIALIHASNGK